MNRKNKMTVVHSDARYEDFKSVAKIGCLALVILGGIIIIISVAVALAAEIAITWITSPIWYLFVVSRDIFDNNLFKKGVWYEAWFVIFVISLIYWMWACAVEGLIKATWRLKKLVKTEKGDNKDYESRSTLILSICRYSLIMVLCTCITGGESVSLVIDEKPLPSLVGTQWIQPMPIFKIWLQNYSELHAVLLSYALIASLLLFAIGLGAVLSYAVCYKITGSCTLSLWDKSKIGSFFVGIAMFCSYVFI